MTTKAPNRDKPKPPSTPSVPQLKEQTEVYEALRQSEERYRELVEHANSIILRWDRDGRITFFNEYAQKFFGFSEQEIIGEHVVGTIVPETESTGRDLQPLMDDICNNPENYEYNVNENITKAKERVWVAWTNKVLEDETGTVVGALSIGTDITKQRRLEEELRQVYKMQAIGKLAGGIAHDFNNMIHIIMGYSGLLMRGDSSTEQHEYAKHIFSTAKHASELTSQLLTFARKGTYQLLEWDLHDVINDVISILGHTLNRKIKINHHLNANNVCVLGDGAQIKSALLNITINAKDAMPNGGTLSFYTENIALENNDYFSGEFNISPGEYLLIKIVDTGSGIDESVLGEIFDPFFTTKELGRGTGLGLAAVYGTAHLHNGAVSCESTKGEGACFNFYLPIMREGITAEDITREESFSYKEFETRPVTILVVDDEKNILSYTKRVCEEQGHTVSAFSSGREAIAFYRDNWQDVDLVLLDMIMPEMDGREVFLHLKNINPTVKVLLASGYSADDDIKTMLNIGVKDFLQKPFTIIQLEEKFQELSTIE